jgi:hypothetical protein
MNYRNFKEGVDHDKLQSVISIALKVFKIALTLIFLLGFTAVIVKIVTTI